jgi:hypothetical protein
MGAHPNRSARYPTLKPPNSPPTEDIELKALCHRAGKTHCPWKSYPKSRRNAGIDNVPPLTCAS